MLGNLRNAVDQLKLATAFRSRLRTSSEPIFLTCQALKYLKIPYDRPNRPDRHKNIWGDQDDSGNFGFHMITSVVWLWISVVITWL